MVPIPNGAKITQPNRGRSTVYSIRLNLDEVAALETIADAAGVPGSTLARSWIVERMQEEQVGLSDAEAELRAAQRHLVYLQRHLRQQRVAGALGAEVELRCCPGSELHRDPVAEVGAVGGGERVPRCRFMHGRRSRHPPGSRRLSLMRNPLILNTMCEPAAHRSLLRRGSVPCGG